MNTTYRWDVTEHAAGYDAAAEHIHPHYLEIQEAILAHLARPSEAELLVVDLGGGSGRLAARILAQFPRARVVVVDQSEAFLALAAARIEPFAGRGSCVQSRLQDDWAAALPTAPAAIVSMSAIHHLDPQEKQRLYQRCYDVLEPLGTLLNGDEIRAEDDAEYRQSAETWATHMRAILASGLVSETMRPMLEAWQDLNVTRFGQPRTSGDDCHETVEAQLSYFCECGFLGVGVPWRKDMWALMQGVK